MSKLQSQKEDPKKQTPNSNYLIEKFPVSDTPFVIIKAVTGKKDEFFPVLGKYRLTSKIFETIEECTHFLESKNWELLFNILSILIKHHHEAKDSKN